MNKYFPNDQYMMMPNHIWVIYTVKDTLMDFIILRHKRFVDMASDFTLQLIFKKLPIVKWNIGSKVATIISKTFLYDASFSLHSSNKKSLATD